jgi:hypothetical protein
MPYAKRTTGTAHRDRNFVPVSTRPATARWKALVFRACRDISQTRLLCVSPPLFSRHLANNGGRAILARGQHGTFVSPSTRDAL